MHKTFDLDIHMIVQDMGAFQFIREYFPKMDIHTSTQMTICNRYGANNSN